MRKLIFFLLLTGCATPEMIRENKDGGRIIVHGSRSVAGDAGKEKAQKMMAAKCPSGYEIIETGQLDNGQTHVGYGQFVTNRELYYDFKCK